MRRLFLIGAALLVPAAGSAYLFRAEIALAVLERAVNAGTEPLPDGLHAAFCGTGSPLPDRTRAGPCLAVLAGERLFVVDAGEGAAETLILMGLQPGDIETVLITHTHSDHFDGLAALALQHWAGRSSTSPLVVTGPAGVERIAAGFNEAYAIDSGHRTEHHGEAVMPPSGFGLSASPFTMPEGEDRLVLIDDGGVRVTAFLVSHAPARGAVGYRFDYGGRALVVSGDTKKTGAIAREARGADLLIHEGISARISAVYGAGAAAGGQPGVARIFEDIQDYHTTPEEAADLAQEAGVGTLAFTHIIPPLVLPGLDAAFLGDAPKRFGGPVWMMEDGDVISLPASGGILRTHRRIE